MARHLPALLVATLVLIPSAAVAQNLPSVSPDARVRVWTPASDKPVVGRLIDLTDTTVTITGKERGPSVLIPRSAITRLDVSQGHDLGKGVLKGAGIGALVGVGLAALSCMGDNSDWYWSPGACAGIGAMMGAPVGAFVGLISGGPDRWHTVMTSGGRRSQVPSRPASAIGVTLRF